MCGQKGVEDVDYKINKKKEKLINKMRVRCVYESDFLFSLY